MKTLTATPTIREIIYPTSDGKPMAETDIHRDLMVDLIETLQDWFEADPMTYVSGNMLLYYEKGNKRRHVSPDVFFVRGIPKKQRDYYLLWEEGVTPQTVIEISSSSTKKEDTKDKKTKYRDILKVQEYFLFDPRGEYLKPSFQAFNLEEGEYVEMPPTDGGFHSAILGLRLIREGTQLRLVDPKMGQQLPTRKERLKSAAADFDRVQAENDELRKQLEAMRAATSHGKKNGTSQK